MWAVNHSARRTGVNWAWAIGKRSGPSSKSRKSSCFFAIGFIVENIMFCLFGLLTGAGHTMVPFCCAVISAYLVRTLLAWYFSRCTFLGFNGIALAYSIAPFVSCAICTLYIASGRWKHSKIKI